MTLGQAGRRGGSVAWGRWHRGTIPARKESLGSSPGKARAKTQVSDATQAPPLRTCSQRAALISQVQKAVQMTALLPTNRRPACLTAAGPLMKGEVHAARTREPVSTAAVGTQPCALWPALCRSCLSACCKQSPWQRVSPLLPKVALGSLDSQKLDAP